MINILRNIILAVFVFINVVFSQGLHTAAYVVNTLGQNLSVVDLETHQNTPDALPLGLYANQGVVHGKKLYVVNSGINEIQIIQLKPLTTIGSIDIGSQTNPWGITFVNDSIAFVSELFTNRVAVVNVNMQQVIQRISVGTAPEGIYYHEGNVFVTNTGFNGAGYDPGTVSIIDAQNYTVTGTLSVGINPQDVTADSAGHLLVACTGNYASIPGSIHIFDLATLAPVDTVHTNSATAVVRATGDGRMVIGSDNGVFVFNQNTNSFEISENDPLPGGSGIAIDHSRNIYITDFNADSLRAYTSSYQKTGAFLVGNGPLSVAIYENPNTAIHDLGTRVGQNFRLLDNYPNPFNPSTIIEFELIEGGRTILDIFNVVGQKIRTLKKEQMEAGVHTVQWNGEDNNGRTVPGGVYFYRLVNGKNRQVKKMQLIR